MWHRFPAGARAWLGVELTPVSHAERLVSALGGFLGIFCILVASWKVLGDRQAALLIVGSMGASAVLVFGVPHGPLSQPWAVAGGHAVSAIVGVACAKAVPWPFVAAALAVGTAIGVMHYLRCIHPPGGATALSAVIGGPPVHALGFGFVTAPVLLNVAIILAAAIAVNACFPWRRYPAAWRRPPARDDDSRDAKPPPGALTHSDFEYALHEIDSVVGVSESDLARIHRLASAHARGAHLEPWQIRRHRFYSNGRYGADWSIREIVSEVPHDDAARDFVTWRTADGDDRPPEGVCLRVEFARWARHEVFRDERSWSRMPR